MHAVSTVEIFKQIKENALFIMNECVVNFYIGDRSICLFPQLLS